LTKTVRLDSRSAREKLKPRGNPYFTEAGSQVDLGYRKLKTGVGSWVARRRGDGRYVATTFERDGDRLAANVGDGLARADGEVSLLAGIEALNVIADHDPNGAGEKAAQEVGARWRAANKEVNLYRSNAFGDLNDALKNG
jgi:hypothetical protein